MEPVLWPEPFDDPRFAFQVKWDGIRLLTWVSGGAIRARTRRGHPREHAYPELEALAEGPDAVYDGEMVVLVDGRPSFPAVLRRDRARDARAVARLARAWPAVYQVFDILWEDGRDWRRQPWQARHERLERLLRGRDGRVARVDAWPGEKGSALFEAVERLGLEGVVAKERTSAYLPGKRSDSWRKIKVWRTRNGVVGGYLPGADGLGSVLIGAYDGPWLRYIGRAGSGLSTSDRRVLRAFLDAHRVPASPFRPAPGGLPAEPVWVEPLLVVTVRFQEWTPGLLLRAPTVVAVARGDPRQCRLEDWGVEAPDGVGRDGLGGRTPPDAP